MANVVNIDIEKLKVAIHDMGWIYNALEPNIGAEQINKVEKRVEKVRNFLNETLSETDRFFDSART